MRQFYICWLSFFILMVLIKNEIYCQSLISSSHYGNSNAANTTANLASIDSLDKVIAQYQKTNNLEKMGYALDDKADRLIEMGQVDAAERIYNQVVVLAEQLHNDTLAYGGIEALGVIYNLRGDFKKEYDINLRRISLSLKIGNASNIMHSYLELAYDYLKLGQQDSMMYCYKKALTYIKQAEPRFVRRLYNSLGEYYYRKGDYEGGLSYYLKATEVCATLRDSAAFLASDLNGVAKSFIKLKNYDKAEQYVTHAYQLSVDNNLKQGRVFALYCFADVKLYKGDTVGAIRIFKETIEKLKSPNDNHTLKSAYEKLASIYILKGDLN